MRGDDEQSGHLFSYVSPEQRVPADHPLRRDSTDDRRGAARAAPGVRCAVFATTGRPSVPPEQLLRALLLQVLYSIRSERMLIEQLEYNLLFRWFVGLAMDADLWVPTTFTKNRTRLLEGEIAARVLRCRDAPGRRGRSALGRTLHRGRLVAAGVGQSQEFSPEGHAAARRRREQSHGGFPRRDAAATTRISRRPIRTRGWRARAARRRAWPTTRTCCSITATDWSAMSARRTRRAPPKSTRPC